MSRFEVIYRDERRDSCELTFDVMCRISERFNCTVQQLTDNPRLDWLAWGLHVQLSEEGKTTLTVENWRKSISEIKLAEADDLNPTNPTA